MDQHEWECKLCTTHNPSTRNECESCYAERYSGEKWQCQKCTVLNPLIQHRCHTCEHPRYGVNHGCGLPNQAVEPSGAAGRDTSGSKDQPSGTCAGVEETNSSCTASEEDWLCDKDNCHTWNRKEEYKCARCSATKPYFPTMQKSLVQREGPQQETVSSLNDGRRDGIQVTATRRSMRRWSAETSENSACLDLNGGATWETAAGGHFEQPSWDWQGKTDEEVLEFPDSECRIVLVGKTGSGKSSTANTILGFKRFESNPGFKSTTKQCQRHNNKRFGLHLEVADTPGLFDTDLDEDTIKKEIARCLGIIAPGPHAIIVVVPFGIRFTEEEEKAVHQVHDIFGVQLLRYMVIVFTHGDRLSTADLAGSDEEEAMKTIIEKSPDALKQLVRSANNRYVVFNNTADDATKSRQVKQLIITIRNLLKVNGVHPYTSRLLEQVEVCMQKRESMILRNLPGNRSQRWPRRCDAGEKRQARDMAREDVAQNNSSLLQQILSVALPHLQSFMYRFLTQIFGKVVTSYCSIQ